MTETPKVGFKLKIFARSLMLAHFRASHSIQELRKRGKSLEADLPFPPWVLKGPNMLGQKGWDNNC